MKGLRKLSSLALALVMVFGLGMESLAAVQTISIDEAVVHGIENSSILDEVEVEIDLAKVSQRRGSHSARKLRRSERDLRDASRQASEAINALDGGVAPQDITVGDITIHAGENIEDKIGKELAGEVISGAKKDIQGKLDSGDYAIQNALEQAGATISSSLDFASLDSLSLDGSANLIELMPEVVFEVTQASFDIYKNNIALLIQKSYYDVLQAQELLKVREKAMERGRKQYEFVKASFEEGMKAKDDVLMAEVYYKSTKIAYEQTQGELESAMVELKKNANLDMSKEIALEDVMITKAEDFDLAAGLENGMKNRLEIKKTLGEIIINNTNFDETKSSYTPNTFQYQEAELLKKKAGPRYEQAKQEVESSIRKSHALVQNTADMLRETDGLIDAAKGNLEIAQLKYDEGFGVNTSLLANLNLQDSAGTIIEVLAAQEKLSEIEENVVKITYAYNLSRMQYKNNIGDFVY